MIERASMLLLSSTILPNVRHSFWPFKTDHVEWIIIFYCWTFFLILTIIIHNHSHVSAINEYNSSSFLHLSTATCSVFIASFDFHIHFFFFFLIMNFTSFLRIEHIDGDSLRWNAGIDCCRRWNYLFDDLSIPHLSLRVCACVCAFVVHLLIKNDMVKTK